MTRKQKLLSFLYVLAGSFLVYGSTLGHDFVWDDLILIVDSDALRKASNFGAFFTTPFFKLAAGMDFPHHRPMVSLLIFFTSLFSGTNPFGYHLTNVVLHAGAVWLFYLFLRKLDLREPLRIFAAALFLCHPVNAESVAWACTAAVLAGGICFLLGLLFSFKLRGASAKTRPIYFLGLAFSYGAGLLSYDLVLVLPAVIFILDILNPCSESRHKTGKVRALELLLLITIALDFLWMRYRLADSMGGFARFQHGDPNAANIILSPGIYDAAAAVLNMITRYFEILIFPLVLSPEAYFGAREWSMTAAAGFSIFALVSMLMLKEKEKRRIFYFSLAWMAVTLLPLIQLVFQGGLFADRYLYFASMGYCLWLVLVLAGLWRYLEVKNPRVWTSRAAAGFSVILCLAFGLRAWDQSKIWRDDVTFWTAASVISPNKPRAHHLLGVSFLRFGYPQEALKSFEKAIQLSPFYPHPYQGMAYALQALGKNQEAESAERRAWEMYALQTQTLLARAKSKN